MAGEVFRFDLDDELFAEIKHNFNTAISSILRGMLEKDVCEGEIALTVKLSLVPADAVMEDGEEKAIINPRIEHRVVTKMMDKSKAEGKISGWMGDDILALEPDGNGGFIALRIPPYNDQTSLF